MSRRDLLIGLQHATQQGIKMREGTNLAEMGEIKPLSLSPKVAAAKSKFGGDKPIDTTGVAGGERSSTGLGMNTTRPSSGGISSRNAGIAPGQRSSTGLGMNTEEYRMKAISDAISGLLESGARTRYITKAGKSEAFHRGVRGTGAVEERGDKLGAMSKQERDEMEGRKKFGELKREAKRNPR